MQEEIVPKVHMANLSHMCKNEVHKQWEVRFKHIYRETNRAANMLAKAALRGDLGFRIIEEILPKLISILQEDGVDCAWPRVIHVSCS